MDDTSYSDRLCAELLARPRPTLAQAYRDARDLLGMGVFVVAVALATAAALPVPAWLPVVQVATGLSYALIPLRTWRRRVRWWEQDRAEAQAALDHRRAQRGES